jgi:hypothetical protein
MSTLKIAKIRHYLNTYKMIETQKQIKAFDYASVKQRVMQLELLQELEFLLKLLDKPEQFISEFKKRCLDRSWDETHSIGFHQEPDSLINRLYKKTAYIYFEPQTIQELLTILLPEVKQCLTVRLSDDYEGSYKEAFNNGFKPIIEVQNLNEVPGIPIETELYHYIICDNLLLDTRDIAHFSLGSHCQFREWLLNNKLKKLADALYQHNQYFRRLKEDMDFYENKGITPRKALEQLIQGLLLGGSNMTGSEIASSSATVAISRFMNYLESLPTQVQDYLKQHKGQRYTLDDVIEKALKVDHCVETAAVYLREIEQSCHSIPIWNTTHLTKLETLRSLQNNYKTTHGISTLKEESTSTLLPEKFILQTIESITLNDYSDLIPLFLNFPLQWYALLLNHMRFKEPAKAIMMLIQGISEKVFNQDQRQALGMAIANLPEKQRLEMLSLITEMLCSSIGSAESMNTFLQCFPIEFQLQLINTTIEDKNLLLNWGEKNSLVLKAFLELLPEDKRLAIVKSRNQFGETILHIATYTPKLLKILLEILPERQRFEAVNSENKYKETVLDYAEYTPESLEIILKLLAGHHKTKAIGDARPNPYSFFASCIIKSFVPVFMSFHKSMEAHIDEP